jgi:hypothetical protein
MGRSAEDDLSKKDGRSKPLPYGEYKIFISYFKN